MMRDLNPSEWSGGSIGRKIVANSRAHLCKNGKALVANSRAHLCKNGKAQNKHRF
jgi:hypothetical protein